jgi:hypothetical protein
VYERRPPSPRENQAAHKNSANLKCGCQSLQHFTPPRQVRSSFLALGMFEWPHTKLYRRGMPCRSAGCTFWSDQLGAGQWHGREYWSCKVTSPTLADFE